MTDPTTAAPAEPKPRTSHAALAGSSPDINHGFMRLIRSLFNSDKQHKVYLGAWLGSLMLLLVVGLPAVNGTTILIDKISDGAKARRAYELERYKLETDVELKKLDRTMLGDGAMQALKAISVQLAEQGQATKIMGEQLSKLSGQVSAIEQRQVSTDKKLGAVAATQQQQLSREKSSAAPRK